MRRVPLLLVLLVLPAPARDAPPNGPRRIDPRWHVLVGATVHVRPGDARTLNVTLRGDRIASVSADAPAAGPRVWDAAGLHVYAGLLDPHVASAADGPTPHWNELITPQRVARAIDAAAAKELRELGFVAAVAAPGAGILRGRATLLSLAPVDSDRSVPRPTVHRESVYQSVAFDRTRDSKRGPPTSQMGAIALLRQALHDGLAANERLCLRADHELELLRAARVAREFGRDALLLGCGTEFRRLDALAATKLPVVVPLRFPRRPDVASLGAAGSTDLRDLMTWEQAPTNLRRLDAAGVRVALTTSRLPRRAQFFPRLREAIRHGLAPERALAMLTTQPAELLGVADRFGTVEAGKLASLVVADGPLFDESTKIRAVWIEGRRHEITPPPNGVTGRWNISLALEPARTATLVVRGPARAQLRAGGKKHKGRGVTIVENRLALVVDWPELGAVALSGIVDGTSLAGDGRGPDGVRFSWSGTREGDAPKKKPDGARPPPVVPDLPGYPFGPYARRELPPQRERLVVRGATVWTCGAAGTIPDGELEIANGRIVYVGARRELPAGTPILDATGKHVTPGIVDCHSHTGISKGVNEAGEAATAEVRIGDVTNPDAINWYRQLAGGVTTVNSLHGSANPIGGQNQVNKVRWGVADPNAMHFAGAPPGIKFALGENVKQSNWGDEFTTRYPQTRMGVESFLRDRFLAAREYARGHDRVDLELEALAEILAGRRLVHCHSYRQDEILMLCRVAKEFGFRIGTFQHVLEGFKVAEAIREQARGGSAFSDWWAYKVEVQDAIPFNGALMHAVGVNVSFNSDSDDLARRLNVEAAKAVRYGGVSREDALRFVTFNPAHQLGIAERVGSLEKGKDADFVVWSGDPLSTLSRCERTWIDGREYFSLEQDARDRATIAAERRRIIARVLAEPDRPERPGDGFTEEDEPSLDCGDCGRFEEARR